MERRSLRRLYMVGGISALVLGTLLIRLFDLQILQHHLLAGLAERQHQKSSDLRGKRGTIYDRRLRELALSIDRESIYLNPSEFLASPQVITQFANPLGLKDSTILE